VSADFGDVVIVVPTSTSIAVGGGTPLLALEEGPMAKIFIKAHSASSTCGPLGDGGYVDLEDVRFIKNGDSDHSELHTYSSPALTYYTDVSSGSIRDALEAVGVVFVDADIG
jgi:hypothetical protein